MKNKLLATSMLLTLLMSFLIVAVHVSPVASTPISNTDYESAVIKVADRLVALRSLTDYGWDWVITDLTSHSPNPSAQNIYGVTALELLDAYKLTSDTKYFDAAKAVADYLVSLGSNRYHYQFDLEFLIEFAEISGDTTYYTFASDVWSWIKANKPEFANGVTLYNWYYTTRYPNSHGGAVWGTGDWAIAALEIGDTAWATDMANVIADNYTQIILGTDPYGFEYVGWGKALKTFQAVDPTAYADEIADIVSILTPLQQADGSFTGWVQDEAYVIMGLVSVGQVDMANRSAVWLVENQGYNSIVGGWKLPEGNEYSEVTSEAGQAIFRVIQAIGTVDLDHYSDGIIDVKTMTISQAIKAAYSGDTIIVHEGTYIEQLVINSSLTIQGMAGAKIVAPDTRSTFTIAESTATWDPIIFAYGSLSGPNTVSVTINGFEIDGGNKAASGYRYVGILCRNVKPGTISNNVIHSLYPPSGKGSGPQTFGLLVYGDSEMTIQYNEIGDFSRGGIGVSGDAGPSIDPHALVQHNTVFGNGLETETNWWAENGIQIGYGATAHVVENDVFDCTVNNPDWSATGILVVDTSDVVVEDNYVEGCDIGIGAVDFPSAYGPPWDYHILSNVLITGNTLVGNMWQIDISNDATSVTVTYNDLRNAIEDGIDVWSYFGDVFPTNVEIHYNNIVGSGSYGVWASEDLTEPVDARFNWWGHETGPYHETSWIYMGEPYGPHFGLGDNVSDYVLYDHWLEYSVPLPEPTISVEPSSYRAKLQDEIFSVNITISNLSVGWKAVAFQFRLCYNSTLLEILNVTEGPFLKDPSWNLHGTWFIYFTEVDPIHGPNIIVGLFLLPNTTGQWTEFPSGSGTLATITFKAIYQHRGIERPPLSCDLKLKSTIIEDADANLIAHNLKHGLYEILPTNIGDVNYDGIVDVKDLSAIGRAFGSTPSHPRWNPKADVNLDGVIDIRDISKAARNFGWVQDPDP